MEKDIETVRTKLQELKKIDAGKKIFGADFHDYLLNPVLTEKQITEFEQRFGIRLPEDYRLFMLRLGNGGAGPYYGLQTLQNSLYSDLDFKRDNELVDPSKPFPFSEPWNMDYEGDPEDEEAYQRFETEYFDDKWETGLLRICNFGCGVSLNLVVNGPEYGNMWVDDRCNDGGIYPDPYFEQTGRTTFIQWYQLWLDISIKEARSK